MNGWTVAPMVRRASVSRQVDVMPSTSKSPKTAMDSRSSSARSMRSATSAMPGMMAGSAQSRSSDGVKNSRPSSGVRIPRATMMRATSGATPSSWESLCSRSGSFWATVQRRDVLSDAMAHRRWLKRHEHAARRKHAVHGNTSLEYGPLRQAVLLNAFHYTHGADSCAAPPAGGAFWGGVRRPGGR